MNNYFNTNYYLNYTQVTNLYGDTYNLAPRMDVDLSWDDSWTSHSTTYSVQTG